MKIKILTEDFSLYIHRPTATDETFAPSGKDSFYVLCPVPNLQASINWEIEGPLLKDKIVKALSETIMPNLDKNIEADFWMTPKDFKNDYRSMHGAGFSIAPIFHNQLGFDITIKTNIYQIFIFYCWCSPGRRHTRCSLLSKGSRKIS